MKLVLQHRDGLDLLHCSIYTASVAICYRIAGHVKYAAKEVEARETNPDI